MFTLANTTNIPVSELKVTGNIHQIDSRESSSGGVISGGTSGLHKYKFVTTVNTPDITSSETPLTIEAQANANFSGGEWLKSSSGNSWNSAVRSVEGFNANEPFAFSWEIASVSGTVRQMAGLDNSPPDTNSYSSIDHAIYQVNNRFYSYVYENGTSVFIGPTVNPDMYVTAGDRFGVEVTAGKLRYFTLKNGVVYYAYESELSVSGLYYWKGAMNRGNGSSGRSKFNNAWVHQDTKLITRSEEIAGEASSLITDEDKDKLATLGMIIENGSTYSNIYYSRSTNGAFSNNGTTHDIDMIHRYQSVDNQDLKILGH